MELEHHFDVPAPIEEVWPLLLDLEQVAPCLPGATLGDRIDDRTYEVGIGIKLGPMQLNYQGRVEIVEADEAARRAVLRAKTDEQRGQGTAEATITMTLSSVGGGTAARSVTDLRLTGRVAQMGRSIVEDVSNRLLAQFSECLSAKAAAGSGGPAAAPPARPIGGVSLALGVAVDRLRRLLGRKRG